MGWVQAVFDVTEGQVIAIDGKTGRGMRVAVIGAGSIGRWVIEGLARDPELTLERFGGRQDLLSQFDRFRAEALSSSRPRVWAKCPAIEPRSVSASTPSGSAASTQQSSEATISRAGS